MTGAWPERKLGDLVRLTSGQSPSAFRFRETGLPYFKVDQLGKSSKYLSYRETPYLSMDLPSVPAGSILIAKRGGAIALNRVRMLSEPGFMDTNVMALTPGDEIEPEFLYYWLLYRGLWDIADVTSVPQINNKHINPLSIALPSLREQRRIAEALQSVDGQLDVLKSVIAKKRAIKQGMMQEILTEAWPETTVGAEFDVQLGKMLDAAKNAGTPKMYIGNRAVQWGHIDLGAAGHVPLSQGDILRFRLRRGDLLVCEGGEVGRAAIWDYDIECYYQKAIHRLRSKHGYNARVLKALLEARASSGGFADYVTQTSIAHLPRDKFLTLPIPSIPDEKQSAIDSMLGDVDAEIAALERHLEATRAIKQGMMQELLTGRTRLASAEASA